MADAEPEIGPVRKSGSIATLRSVAGTRFSGISALSGGNFSGTVGRFATQKRTKWLQTARHGKTRRAGSSIGPGSDMGASIMSRKTMRPSVRGGSIRDFAAQAMEARKSQAGYRDVDDARSIYSLAKELDSSVPDEGEDDGSEVASVVSLSMLSGFGPGTHADFRTPCTTQAARCADYTMMMICTYAVVAATLWRRRKRRLD